MVTTDADVQAYDELLASLQHDGERWLREYGVDSLDAETVIGTASGPVSELTGPVSPALVSVLHERVVADVDDAGLLDGMRAWQRVVSHATAQLRSWLRNCMLAGSVRLSTCWRLQRWAVTRNRFVSRRPGSTSPSVPWVTRWPWSCHGHGRARTGTWWPRSGWPPR